MASLIQISINQDFFPVTKLIKMLCSFYIPDSGMSSGEEHDEDSGNDTNDSNEGNEHELEHFMVSKCTETNCSWSIVFISPLYLMILYLYSCITYFVRYCSHDGHCTCNHLGSRSGV